MLKVARKPKKDPSVTITLKVPSAKEKRELEANAKKYANGNLSLWLRYAGTHHKPAAKDLE